MLRTTLRSALKGSARSTARLSVNKQVTGFFASRTAMNNCRVLQHQTASFSVLAPRFKSALTAADAQLVGSLKTEIEIETSDANEEALARPAGFEKFLQDTGFSIIEKEGQDDVELVKKNGGETVHVFFAVSDITNSELEGEDFEGAIEENGEEGASVEEDLSAEPVIRLNIVVEKASGKALGIEAIAQDDFVVVESLTPFDSAELALSEAAEADYKRRGLYQGPPFASLDDSVQGAVDAYLEARDIDGDLAHFIIEYASYRENQEYIKWLERIKNVVEN